MSIDLHLSREEVPILKNGAFYLPIHKGLLNPRESVTPVPVIALFESAFYQLDEDIKRYLSSGQLSDSQEGS